MMDLKKKTDNGNLIAKIVLREYFLDRYHAGKETTVLDCCEGDGVIWGRLSDGRDCRRFGLDLKPSPGRLRMDSRRFLLSGNVAYDVVDIDTYGSPWGHWTNLLPRVMRPMTVFLTCGLVQIFGGNVEDVVRRRMGLVFPSLHVPASLINRLNPIIPERMIGLAWLHNLRIIEAVEALSERRTVRYFGIRLEPRSVPETL